MANYHVALGERASDASAESAPAAQQTNVVRCERLERGRPIALGGVADHEPSHAHALLGQCAQQVEEINVEPSATLTRTRHAELEHAERSGLSHAAIVAWQTTASAPVTGGLGCDVEQGRAAP